MKVLVQGLVLAIASSFFVVPIVQAQAAPPKISRPKPSLPVPEPGGLGLVAAGVVAAAVARALKQR